MSQASRLRQIFIQVLVIAWTIHTKPYQRADNLPLPIGASASLQLPYARLILPPLDTSRFDGTAWQPQLAPDNHKLQKPPPGTSSEGPGTDMSQASRLRQIFIQSSRDSKMLDCNSVVTVSFTKHSCSGDGHVLSFCLFATVDTVEAGRDIARTAGHRSDAG
ncbi:uncharacterized protein ISCGN_031565 [Ixodes scapularis]